MIYAGGSFNIAGNKRLNVVSMVVTRLLCFTYSHAACM